MLVPQRRVNWLALRAEYVEGITDTNGQHHWPTYAELSARHHVNASNIRDRGSHEHWPDLRAQFQHTIDEERRAARATEIARIGADIDLRVIRSSAIGLGIAEARLEEFGRMATQRATSLRQQNGNNQPPPPPAPDVDSVAVLARTVREWYDLASRALGTDNPTLRVTMANGPLSLDVELTAGERDVRTAAILAVLMQAEELPGDVLVNGHGNGDGVGAAVIDVGSRTSSNGGVAAAADDEVHPEDFDDGEPER